MYDIGGRLKRAALLAVLCMTTGVSVIAQVLVERDTVQCVVHFRQGHSTLDPHFHDNDKSLRTFTETLLALRDRPHTTIGWISIVASASPEGSIPRNQELAQERAAVIWNYLNSLADLHTIPYKVEPLDVDWNGLYRLVESSREVPHKEEVLHIIRHTPEAVTRGGRQGEERLRQLKQLHGGVSYEWMYRHFFPKLRHTSVLLVCMVERKVDPVPSVTPSLSANSSIEPVDSLPVFRTGYLRPYAAVKTNLLFDALSLLNVELEVPIGRRWSVAAEWMFPWWLWEEKQHCLQILSATVEGRYWFNVPAVPSAYHPLEGWFAGVYASSGKYDLEWDRKGIQGEFFIATGISAGYVHRLARDWRLELSAGIGLLKTHYREYDAMYSPVDYRWHLIWQRNGNYTWTGPTRAKVSLVWYPHFRHFKKKGGKR